MEKYFKPVHSPSNSDKSKTQKHHHHHLEEPRADRHITCEYTDRNTDDSYGHYFPDGHYHPNHHCPDAHPSKPFPQSEEEDFVYDRTTAPVTLSWASSSSITSSSSSSSSSTSWFTEETSDFSLRHAERPRLSLSCSNIHDSRRFYQLDDNTDPIVFATIKHGSNSSVCSEVHGASRKGKQVFAPLGHSLSDDAFMQQGDGRKIAKSKLNRSLEFSEEDIMLGVSNGPKRAVSSSQLPGKGILKKKEPSPDIRKARSMEVLSSRVPKEQTSGGQGAKADVEKAKVNIVQEKLKFSAFLDEITKQVISPSDLKVLGLNTNESTINEIHDLPKPELPPKKHRKGSVEGSESKQQSKHAKAATNSARKYFADSAKSDRIRAYVATNHHGSPPPHHSSYASHSKHHKSSRKDKRAPCHEASGYGRSGPHLTDGTSTSPELVQPKHRHKPMPVPRNQSPLSEHRGTTNSLPSSSHGSGGGLGSESSSSKSDSSRTRETVSTATSSDHGNRYHSWHATEQHRGTQCETDRLHALQEENADLHQNLLQTVVCIESLEAELQQTRDELIHVKEKYKSLLESHSGTQQEHLHVETEMLSSERQYMFSRVAQLTSELQDAQETIAALENINVPNLIKELLEKHFFTSAGAKQQFLTATTKLSHFPSSPKRDNQSYTLNVGEVSHDWLLKSEAVPQRPTAFTPFKQGSTSDGSILVSCTDFNNDYYNKMAGNFAAASPPLYAQPSTTTIAADMPPKRPVDGENCPGMGGGGVKVVVSDQPDVTAMSAQQILNDFVQQLWAQKEAESRESNKLQ